jgi:hypothetical protein
MDHLPVVFGMRVPEDYFERSRQDPDAPIDLGRISSLQDDRHCVLAVGYDPQYFYILDSLGDGRGHANRVRRLPATYLDHQAFTDDFWVVTDVLGLAEGELAALEKVRGNRLGNDNAFRDMVDRARSAAGDNPTAGPAVSSLPPVSSTPS